MVTVLTARCRYDKTQGVIRMRMASITRATALSALLISLLALGVLAQQSGTTFSDSFHNRALDNTHWKAGKVNAFGGITATAQGLQMTLSSRNATDFFAETLWLTCRISGDFSAQVDFNLLDWQAYNGVRLGIGVRPNALPLGSTALNGTNGKTSGLRGAIAERLSLVPGQASAQPSGGEFYVGEFNGIPTFFVPTGRPSGKLRMARVQSLYTSYYWDGKLWVAVGSWAPTSGVEDVWLALQLWGYESSPGVQTVLENFSITANALNCS